MSKFSNGKIYKVVDIGYNKCYIGSTTEELSQRMARHRRDYKAYLLGKKHKISVFLIFDEYGVENCKIEWIEDCCCNYRRELEAREGEHIRRNDCVNRIIVGRTDKEYRDDKKGHLRNHIHCDCGGTYQTTNKAQHFRTKKHQEWLKQQETQIE